MWVTKPSGITKRYERERFTVDVPNEWSIMTDTAEKFQVDVAAENDAGTWVTATFAGHDEELAKSLREQIVASLVVQL